MPGKKTISDKSFTFTIDRQSLYYRVLGSGSPLVLLHGYGVSGHVWEHSLPYLSQQRQVFVVDLPGHGHSKLTRPWCLREVAPLLVRWLRQMQLPPVALMGHSMGGAIAIHMSAYAPEIVERLVLVNAAGLPLETKLPVLAIRSARSMLQPGGGRYPRSLVWDILRRPRLRLLWQAAQEMMSSDFRAELAKITVPTLIIWGERDILLPISLGEALSAALPHAAFVRLPDCGHRPPLAQPRLFSRLVLEFLEG
jgi:pimeloyl-ACP methyl ester carboxylesterase